MKKIYKYPLKFLEYQIVEIPMNGVIVDIEYQDDDIFMWVMFDTKLIDIKEKREIGICGTGQSPDPSTQNYIKTLHKDGFVWHFFEG